ncbi:MAG: GGDEF domain-containing protein [Polyangiaceae bacterium]
MASTPTRRQPSTPHPTMETEPGRDRIPTLVNDEPELHPVDTPAGRNRCLLTVVSGTEFLGIHRLLGAELVVGRGDDVHIHVEDPYVSQRHARFFRGPLSEIWVVDLGSRNGTFIAGARLDEPRRLRDGEYVHLGRNCLIRCGLHDELSERTVLQLYESSTTDPLTGAYNRRYFEAQLEVEVSYARRHESPLALLLIDLDGFKRLNDRHGHHAGDAMLRLLALEVQRALRPEDVFARYGGDEFVILARATTLENAERLAERLRETVGQLSLGEVAPKAKLSASIGVAARAGSSACSAPLLVALADRAMYRAKARGGNQVSSLAVP